MKKTFKQLFALVTALSFIFVFSVSVGAAQAITEAFEILSLSNRTLNVMDFDTKHIIRQISQSQIPDYASQTDTTYDLSSLNDLNLPEIRLSEVLTLAQNENSVSPSWIIDPDASLLDSFFPHAPRNGAGMPNAPYAGVVAIYIDKTQLIDVTVGPVRSQGLATGFLISPTVMITAAHVVMESETEYFHDVRVYPFTHQEELPNVTGNDYVTIDKVIYDSQYTHSPLNYDKDWAIVTLNEPINNAYYFACTYDVNTVFLNTVARVIGYPGGNPEDSGYYELGNYLYLSMGNVVLINDDFIQYEAAILSGNSGSPIIGNSNLCCGIVTYDVDTNFELQNWGTRITTSIYNCICYVLETF